MSGDSQPSVRSMDYVLFRKNRDGFPPEQLVPYWGKQVAWSLDGMRILAAADTDEEIDLLLARLGIGTDEVVFGYVDDPNVVQTE